MQNSTTALQLLEVSHRFSHNNLHINCSRFGPQQACSVMALVRRYHTSCKQIFIDVSMVAQPHPFAAESFKAAIRNTQVPPRQIIFKGTSGFSLAQDGNRVLIKRGNRQDNTASKKHTCCGKCAHCHCGGKNTHK